MMSSFIFIFGLAIGSFLNAVIYRSAYGGSIFAKSSKCPRCGHKLSWIDLIPVLSFLWLRAKCRYCRKPISWQYPLVELITGISFILIYLNNVIPSATADGIQEMSFYNWILTFVRMTDYGLVFFQFIFASFLIVIFVYDLKHYLILDKFVIPAAILAVVYQIINGRLLDGLAGALLLAGFFALLYFVSRGRWIGAGDIKLGAFLGFLVPWPATLALFFLAYFLGATASVVLIAFKLKKFTDRLPFGTFLTSAAFIAMLWGEEIIEWYFKLIGI